MCTNINQTASTILEFLHVLLHSDNSSDNSLCTNCGTNIFKFPIMLTAFENNFWRHFQFIRSLSSFYLILPWNRLAEFLIKKELKYHATEKFEGPIRSCNFKDRQYHGQKKEYKTNKQWSTKYYNKLKIVQHEPH